MMENNTPMALWRIRVALKLWDTMWHQFQQGQNHEQHLKSIWKRRDGNWILHKLLKFWQSEPSFPLLMDESWIFWEHSTPESSFPLLAGDWLVVFFGCFLGEENRHEQDICFGISYKFMLFQGPERCCVTSRALLSGERNNVNSFVFFQLLLLGRREIGTSLETEPTKVGISLEPVLSPHLFSLFSFRQLLLFVVLY